MLPLIGLILTGTYVSLGLLKSMWNNWQAYKRLKRDSRGLNMVPGFNLILGHLANYSFNRNKGDLLKLHARLGKNICCLMGSHPTVLSCDLDLIKKFAIDEKHIHTNRGHSNFPMERALRESLIFVNGQKWRRIRRLVELVMSSRRVKSETVTSRLDKSVDKLMGVIEDKLAMVELTADEKQQQAGNRKTSLEEVHFEGYMMDAAMSCIYEQENTIDLRSKDNKLLHMMTWAAKMTADNPLLAIFTALEFINFMAIVDWFVWHLSIFGRHARFVLASIQQQVVRRLSGESGDDQLMSPLIDSYRLGKLTKNELFHSSFSLLLAGHKTTGDVLLNTIYFVSTHKEVQNKLRESLIAHGRDSAYLTWVINETIRLMPPVPLGCSRQLEHDVKCSDGMGVVPKGTYVLTPLFTIHRLSEYWGPDVDEFRPERFELQHEFHPCQFMPFGVGARICPGREFGLEAIKVLLNRLLVKYELTGRRKQDEGYASPFLVYTVFNEPIQVDISPI